MGVQTRGIPLHVAQAFERALGARLKVISVSQAAIAGPLSEVSPRVPELIMMQIVPEKIGLVIGSVGKIITTLKNESGADVVIVVVDGTVFISRKRDTSHSTMCEGQNRN